MKNYLDVSSRIKEISEVPLSSREKEILRLIERNLLNKEIGEKLFISEKTVKRHIANMYKKLGVENRSQAQEMAKEMELA